MIHGNGDPVTYLKYAEEYIDIGMGNIEDRDPLCQTINFAISMYLNLGMIDKVSMKSIRNKRMILSSNLTF